MHNNYRQDNVPFWVSSKDKFHMSSSHIDVPPNVIFTDVVNIANKVKVHLHFNPDSSFQMFLSTGEGRDTVLIPVPSLDEKGEMTFTHRFEEYQSRNSNGSYFAAYTPLGVIYLNHVVGMESVFAGTPMAHLTDNVSQNGKNLPNAKLFFKKPYKPNNSAVKSSKPQQTVQATSTNNKPSDEIPF